MSSQVEEARFNSLGFSGNVTMCRNLTGEQSRSRASLTAVMTGFAGGYICDELRRNYAVDCVLSLIDQQHVGSGASKVRGLRAFRLSSAPGSAQQHRSRANRVTTPSPDQARRQELSISAAPRPGS